MKKVVALLLALMMSACLFTACDDEPAVTTTGSSSTDGTTTSTTDTTTETTKAQDRPYDFHTDDLLDNVTSGYYCKILRDEADETKILGVAVVEWKSEHATANMVFKPTFDYRAADGTLTTFNVIRVGMSRAVPTNFHSIVESIEIQEGIKAIGDKAFTGCPNLKTVSLPEGLTSIGKMSFWNCKSLESIVIPSTVTEIGNYAFSDCVALKSATLPRAFESQVDNIFDGCKDIVITYID